MDVFAGSEPREFIPFRLGKEANGQPNLVLPGTSNTEETPKCNNPSVAEETDGPNESEAAPDTTMSSQGVTLNRLPSAILKGLRRRVRPKTIFQRKPQLHP